MSAAANPVRRATLEDLPALRPLWTNAGLPVANLEKRLREFQVAYSEDGTLRGCIALEISDQQGRLHSEAYADPSDRERWRPLLWERMMSVARNHGLLRLWTNAPDPFWTSAGFQSPDAPAAAKLPGAFAGAPGQSWSVLKLREELPALLSIEKEFALFKQSQRRESEDMFRQARVLKTLACAMAVVMLLIAGGVVIYVLRALPEFRRKKAPQPNKR